MLLRSTSIFSFLHNVFKMKIFSKVLFSVSKKHWDSFVKVQLESLTPDLIFCPWFYLYCDLLTVLECVNICAILVLLLFSLLIAKFVFRLHNEFKISLPNSGCTNGDAYIKLKVEIHWIMVICSVL